MIFANRSEAVGYLSAMIDGEGHVNVHGRQVIVSNTDTDIIDAVTVALDLLGIEYKTVRSQRTAIGTQMWIVRVSRHSELIRLANTVNLRCTRKRDDLTTVVTTYKRPKPARHYA